MEKDFLILAINPGNTSTKIGIYRNETALKVDNVAHDDAALKGFSSIMDQKDYRTGLIRGELKAAGFEPGDLAACVGRGGLLRPLASGTYRVDRLMIEELGRAERGEHASNLGAVIANDIAAPVGIPAFIVDPVCVDEMQDVARLSGWSDLQRESLFHALNHKAVAKRYAKSIGKRYADLRLVVAHLGSGISIAAHLDGKVVDVFNPRDEGPFSPDRSGGLPTLGLAKACFSGKYDYKTVEKALFGQGGVYSYLGTRDLKKVLEMIAKGDAKAALVLDAMVYQIAKYIGATATVLEGKVDAIILTGGMAHDAKLCDDVTRKVSFIAPVVIHAGEDELQALAEGALRVLRGEEESRDYTQPGPE